MMKDLTLLHMPESTNSPKFQPPKLLKVVLPGYKNEQRSNTPRKVLEVKNTNIPQNEVYKIPKLIDLRKVNSVFNSNTPKNNSENVPPKLLKLPIIPVRKSVENKHNTIENRPVINIIDVPTLSEFKSNNNLAFVESTVRRTTESNVSSPRKVKIKKDESISTHPNPKKEKVSETERVTILSSPKREKNIHPPAKLLESPKREKIREVKEEKPIVPKLIDVRSTEVQPVNEKQFIKVDINENNKRSMKRAKRRAMHSEFKDIDIGKNRRSRKQAIESDYSDNDFSFKSTRKRNKKTASDQEEEIYNVIYDLVVKQKQKRKKKRKQRINIFDIIDNIPLTTESESSPEVMTKKYKSKLPTINNSSKTETTEQKSFKNYYNPYTQDIFPTIPGPIEQNNKISTMEKEVTENQFPSNENKQNISNLEKFKPRIPKYLDLANFSENDPLSWLNIIRNAQTDTKDTQTNQSDIEKDFLPISVEVQTEMKEMIEIPKTQTFFTNNIPEQESIKTKELCDRIRNEVIEKLEPKVITDNKTSQTISSASTQTEIFGATINKVEEIFEKPFKQNTVQVNLPPDLISKIQYTDSGETKNNQYLNVIDIEKDICDENNKNILSTENAVNKKQEFDNNKVTVNHPENVEKLDNVIGFIDYTNNKEKIVNSPSRKPKEIGHSAIKNDRASASFLPGTTYKIHHKISDDLLTEKSNTENLKRNNKPEVSTSKSRNYLSEHIDNFTAGLDAIEEIHETIERELKNSKFLFNTISTLQDGFTQPFNDERNITEKTNYKADSNKYSVHKYKPINEPFNRNTLEHFNELGSISEQDGSVTNQLDYEINDRSKTFESLNRIDTTEGFEEIEKEIEQRSKLQKNDDSELLQERNLELLLNDVSPILNRNQTNEIAGDYVLANNDEQKLKDELFKEEIRKRISQPIEDPSALRREAKHRKLIKWMKEKRSQRHEEYMKDLDEKRNKEFRPFTSKRTFTTKEIDENTSLIEETKKALLEENNEERKKLAEILADRVINKSKLTTKEDEILKEKWKHKKEGNFTPANKQNIKIPVRETRTSKIRKRALVNQMISAKNNARKYDEKRKKTVDQKHSKNKNIGLTTKTTKINCKFDNETSHYISNRLEESLNVSRYVTADEFVTQGTFENYLTKSQISFNENLKNISQVNNHKGFISADRKSVDLLKKKKDNYRNEPFSNLPHNTMNNKQTKTEINSTLRNNLRASDTLELLNEVDRMLMNESEFENYKDNVAYNSDTGGSIDWNEVENILNASN